MAASAGRLNADAEQPAEGAPRRGPSVADLLRNSRFELLPLDGIEEQVLEHLATDTKVTVTASPRKGLEATLELSERLSNAGYPVVPHLSARLVRDRAHLEEVLARLSAAGIRELFVPAGDATEPGEFQGAADLLEAMGEARTQFDRDRHHRLPREPSPDLRRGDHPRDVRQGRDGHGHRQPALLRPGDDRVVDRRGARAAA